MIFFFFIRMFIQVHIEMQLEAQGLQFHCSRRASWALLKYGYFFLENGQCNDVHMMWYQRKLVSCVSRPLEISLTWQSLKNVY